MFVRKQRKVGELTVALGKVPYLGECAWSSSNKPIQSPEDTERGPENVGHSGAFVLLCAIYAVVVTF